MMLDYMPGTLCPVNKRNALRAYLDADISRMTSGLIMAQRYICPPGNLDAETHMPGRAYLGIKKGEDNGCCLHLILINRLLDYQSGFCLRLGFLSISLSGMGQR